LTQNGRQTRSAPWTSHARDPRSSGNEGGDAAPDGARGGNRLVLERSDQLFTRLKSIERILHQHPFDDFE
jgi:hypothetical protein